MSAGCSFCNDSPCQSFLERDAVQVYSLTRVQGTEGCGFGAPSITFPLGTVSEVGTWRRALSAQDYPCVAAV